MKQWHDGLGRSADHHPVLPLFGPTRPRSIVCKTYRLCAPPGLLWRGTTCHAKIADCCDTARYILAMLHTLTIKSAPPGLLWQGTRRLRDCRLPVCYVLCLHTLPVSHKAYFGKGPRITQRLQNCWVPVSTISVAMLHCMSLHSHVNHKVRRQLLF